MKSFNDLYNINEQYLNEISSNDDIFDKMFSLPFDLLGGGIKFLWDHYKSKKEKKTAAEEKFMEELGDFSNKIESGEVIEKDIDKHLDALKKKAKRSGVNIKDKELNDIVNSYVEKSKAQAKKKKDDESESGEIDDPEANKSAEEILKIEKELKNEKDPEKKKELEKILQDKLKSFAEEFPDISNKDKGNNGEGEDSNNEDDDDGEGEDSNNEDDDDAENKEDNKKKGLTPQQLDQKVVPSKKGKGKIKLKSGLSSKDPVVKSSAEKIAKGMKKKENQSKSFNDLFPCLFEASIEDITSAMSTAKGDDENEIKNPPDDISDEQESSDEEDINVTSMPTVPEPGEAPPEPPELDDFALMPFKDKVNGLIKLVKEFGYSSVDFDMEDGKSFIMLDGEMDDKLKKSLNDFSKDAELEINFETNNIDKDKKISKITFKNKIDYKRFKDILKIQKRKSIERTNQEMGLPPSGM